MCLGNIIRSGRTGSGKTEFKKFRNYKNLFETFYGRHLSNWYKPERVLKRFFVCRKKEAGAEVKMWAKKDKDKGEAVRKVLLDNYESYYRLAFAYVHNEADAMDIVQEGAYRAMLKADDLREVRFAGTWVYRIMINEAKKFLRNNRKETGELDENLAAEGVYRDIDLEEAVEKLPEAERTLIILRFYEDKQLSEIAEILQENLNTVKSRLYRVLRKLREELAEQT